MRRRRFLSSCAVMSGAAAFAAATSSWADATPTLYRRVRLADIHGAPIRTATLVAETNYVFQYPYAATPCLLVKLGRRVAGNGALRRQDGSTYAWQGGVGPAGDVVAFSAICAHKLAYPTRDVTFIRFQREASATSSGRVIHCCADHSVYDPAAGARVVAGPAPQPLAAIVLEHDAARDELYALGTVGAEQFDAFFDKYQAKLALEYGAKARAAVDETSVLRELDVYCRTTIRC